MYTLNFYMYTLRYMEQLDYTERLVTTRVYYLCFYTELLPCTKREAHAAARHAWEQMRERESARERERERERDFIRNRLY